MKKIISAIIIFVLLCFGVYFKKSAEREAVVIYTSTEEYNLTLLQEKLDERFPEYNVVIESMSTSNIASKVIEEGAACEADIVYAMEYGYLEKMVAEKALANFGNRYDSAYELYEEDAINEKFKGFVIPNLKVGGAVILNNSKLQEMRIAKPTSYKDLLKPEYKGLISMPSPKSSGTGYLFYKSLVNAWGLEKTLEYFDGFYKNICNTFTSSGSGPVKALIQGEAAIGLGMISQAVDEINGGRNDFEIVFFEEGSPYSMYGSCVVKGREENKAVMAVMDYITNEYADIACSKYYPESFFKGKIYEIKNFPSNIIYADMKNNTITEKEKLLKAWRY